MEADPVEPVLAGQPLIRRERLNRLQRITGHLSGRDPIGHADNREGSALDALLHWHGSAVAAHGKLVERESSQRVRQANARKPTPLTAG